MTSEEILKIISDNFLCVRRLPFEVITYWTYKEGDEHKLGSFGDRIIHTESGKTLNVKREVVTGYGDWPKDKKWIKETRQVEKGGWYYVKEVLNTSSTIRFQRKYDEFFAPTLEEAIQLYLKSRSYE